MVLGLAAGAQVASAGDESAQAPSRAAALAAARDAKAANLKAPERSRTERALYWYDNQYVLARVFGGWHGVHIGGGDFPAGAGIKFGLGFTHRFAPGVDPNAMRPNDAVVDAVAAYSTRGYTRLAASWGVRNVGGASVDVRLIGDYHEFPQEDFFGLGRNSLRSNRTDYLLESRDVGAEATWRPLKRVNVTGGVWSLNPIVGRGTDPRFPSTERVFSPAMVPALAAQPDFIRSDAGVAYDWRDNPLHPHGGGRYGARLSHFDDRDLDAFSFRRVELDAEQYVPLPNRFRTLALRAAAVLTEAESGNDVPFFYQPTLGGSRLLRGFREFRFRDRNSLAFTAEYRWEAWWALDGALFVDAGTVAPEARNLRVGDMDVSYGVGFRVHSNSAFVARLDLAFSREGFVPLLRFEHVF
jgi:hypothetical protein